MVVISNGRKLSDESADGGMKRVHWLQDKPHASYLVCLVAGKFHKLEDKYRDISLGFYAQPSLAEHAANSFADTKAIMAFYEGEIGVPYPWDKYDQATIRDFTSGGMENTTITTLFHGTLFSKETENIRSSRNLDAHEMAHQWFGDYVTCEDWSHLWLNEGFATYYTHLYNEHKLGATNFSTDCGTTQRGVSCQTATTPAPSYSASTTTRGSSSTSGRTPRGVGCCTCCGVGSALSSISGGSSDTSRTTPYPA